MAIICLVSELLRNSSGPPENHSKRTTLIRQLTDRFPYLTLLRVGFTMSRITGSQRTGSVTTTAVGSYPAISPLPRLKAGAVYFLWHYPYSDLHRNPGRYPALCSVKFGLSSSRKFGKQLPGMNYFYSKNSFLLINSFFSN